MKREGFTLIELIIVILIISILTTFAVTNYKRMVLKSRFNEAISVVRSIVFAQERYRQENGGFYPPSGIIKNEDVISEQLKVNLSESNNFNYFVEKLTGVDDGNFSIRVMIRADDWDRCTDKISSTICKQSGSADEDTWVKQYNREEDKHYIEFTYPTRLTGDYVEGGVSYEHFNDD